MKKNEAVYLTLFQKSYDPVMLIKGDRFIDCNEATLRFMEMDSKDEFLNKKPHEISPKYQFDGKLSKDKGPEMISIAVEKGNHKFEWVHNSNKGKKLIVEVTLTIITIEGEQHIYVIWRNLNDIKKVENELLFAKERAEESDRLKSAFMENISHEIRTPMNSIVGFSQLISLQESTEEDKIKYNEYIRKAANSLLLIIDNILDVSSIKAGVFKTSQTEINLNKLFEEVYKFAKSETELTILEVEAITPSKNENIVIVKDAIKIKKTLYQLILNSIKFTEKGFIRFGYSKKGEMLEFFVSDTGIGISNEDQKIIFSHFRKGNSEGNKIYGGTGLGLSIAKANVENMGGRIWINSKLNKGTQVFFTVPFEEETN